MGGYGGFVNTVIESRRVVNSSDGGFAIELCEVLSTQSLIMESCEVLLTRSLNHGRLYVVMHLSDQGV